MHPKLATLLYRRTEATCHSFKVFSLFAVSLSAPQPTRSLHFRLPYFMAMLCMRRHPSRLDDDVSKKRSPPTTCQRTPPGLTKPCAGKKESPLSVPEATFILCYTLHHLAQKARSHPSIYEQQTTVCRNKSVESHAFKTEPVKLS